MKENLYEILGVDKSATADEIRSAYRKLAKKLHPDLNPNDDASAEQFKKVSSAYAILSDEEARGKYDSGEIDGAGQERPDPRFYRDYAGSQSDRRYEQTGGFQDAEDLSGIFADLFARRGEYGPDADFPLRGRDAQYTLDLAFIESAKGGKKRIFMPDGGALDVAVPQGVRDGQVIRLKGKGGPGVNGGPDGDALIAVTVSPHPVFTRDGQDVRIVLPVSLAEAVLGGKIEVPTIHGPVNVSIPKRASSGQLLRLKGKGIQGKSGTSGDQYVELKIVQGGEPDDALEAAIRDWQARQSFDARAGWAGKETI